MLRIYDRDIMDATLLTLKDQKAEFNHVNKATEDSKSMRFIANYACIIWCSFN